MSYCHVHKYPPPEKNQTEKSLKQQQKPNHNIKQTNPPLPPRKKPNKNQNPVYMLNM